MRRLLLLCLLPAGLLVGVAPPSVGDPAVRQVTFSRWEGGPAFRTGASSGLRLKHGALVLKDSSKRRAYHGTTYAVGSCSSTVSYVGVSLDFA